MVNPIVSLRVLYISNTSANVDTTAAEGGIKFSMAAFGLWDFTTSDEQTVYNQKSAATVQFKVSIIRCDHAEQRHLTLLSLSLDPSRARRARGSPENAYKKTTGEKVHDSRTRERACAGPALRRRVCSLFDRRM